MGGSPPRGITSLSRLTILTRGYQELCNTTAPILGTDSYLVPQPGTWWACNKGLTPCVSAKVLSGSNDFCVMVQIIPRVFYHPAETLENQYDEHPTRFPREPVSLTLAVMLGLGVATGVGTGRAALIQGSRRYIELQAAVDEDLRALEQSVSKLEQSLTSLSEVVLQNRRGLDLLFLKEGGLCAALGEECCFYAYHSGVIRESMAKLRDRLNKRQRDREAQQGWFESWFNQSPWMTTLISTIMGPLVILLLLLTFGPCILNRLLQFVQERLSITQALVLTQQCRALQTEEINVP
ncbi:Envelope glycoprotein [Vulpes lagopus]